MTTVVLHRPSLVWILFLLLLLVAKFDETRAWTARTTNVSPIPLHQEDRRHEDDERYEATSAAASLRPVKSLVGSNQEKQPWDRRRALLATTATLVSSLMSPQRSAAVDEHNGRFSPLQVIRDPDTYSALTYSPPSSWMPGSSNENTQILPPLIVVLHGAGRNNLDILDDLANPQGEHAGLIPSLIASRDFDKAPSLLLHNCSMVAPYSYGKTSFYQDGDDCRAKLLRFLDYCCETINNPSSSSSSTAVLRFDPHRIFLWGFSDGATLAVELLTSQKRKFAGGVICSYGYSGATLPPQALQRLSGIPMWMFHSADDVIFSVANSDRLVEQLRTQEKLMKDDDDADENATATTKEKKSIIKYNRYEKDPEQLPPRVRGHSMGITASKLPEVYQWILEQPPR